MKRIFIFLVFSSLFTVLGFAVQGGGKAAAKSKKLYTVTVNIKMPAARKPHNRGRESRCHIECSMTAADINKNVPIPYILLYLLFEDKRGEKRVRIHAFPQSAKQVLYAGSPNLLKMTLNDPARDYVSPKEWKNKVYKMPMNPHRDFSLKAYHVDVWGLNGIIASKDWSSGKKTDANWWKQENLGL